MLEPGAGSGNIIKTLQKYGDFSIDAVEIRPEEADKSLREVTAVHINIDPTEASELGEMIASSLRNGSSMLRGGA